jgi:hypothetical protein
MNATPLWIMWIASRSIRYASSEESRKEKVQIHRKVE